MTAGRAPPWAGCNLRASMRLSLIVPLLAALLLLAGCGDKASVVTKADTEGVTVDVGGLKYQVQISRYLNPNDQEDKYYLRGLPQATNLDPGKDAVWFAVFMRVKNESGGTLTPTNQFTITDTENNKFEPLQFDPNVNPFLYIPEPIPHAGVLPEPETPAANGPIQGSMLLFKINAPSLQNRPLVLHISGAGGEEATVDLDL
jgi:hypothetical protein